MGDGKAYDNMEQQVDITCEACHFPRLYRVNEADSKGARLAFLNKKTPPVTEALIGFTKKGTPLYNLQKKGEKVLLYRKLDGQPLEMGLTSQDKPYHKMKGHSRLSCQACHSAWTPQCYGCHLTFRENAFQEDWITGRELPGRWKEARSYLRFSKPALGLRAGNRIFPVSPCQVFVSVFDKAGEYRKRKSFHTLTMSGFDPHTTLKSSRTCLECHGDPKVLGLGEGALCRQKDQWIFRPTYDASASGIGASFPLDGFVNLDGTPLQTGSIKGTRAFNKEELDRILSVNACVGCHSRYEDPIFKDFAESRKRFRAGKGLPCLQ
jgi:hypothetical protein